MRAVQMQRHARPDQACACIEVADPGAPGSDEAVVEIRAAAINPADLLMMEGGYPGPEIPALVGIEGAGVVIAVGDRVEDLAIGDHVMSLGRANWAERVRAPAASFIRLSEELIWADAAQIKANPPTALLMLQRYVDLEPGDWVAQNAANSAVGRHVVRLAQERGIRTANIVRRPELVETMTALGADLTLVDSADVAARIRSEAGRDARIRLGIDAIGGGATSVLAGALSDGGVVVTHSFLSGEPCRMSPRHLMAHGMSLKGFWLAEYMRTEPRAEIEAMYQGIAQRFIAHTLSSPVEASYPLERIGEALAHARRESRAGKILLTPTRG